MLPLTATIPNEDICQLPTKVVGRVAPEDTSTEALADARFDGRVIAPLGVRASDASEPVHSGSVSRKFVECDPLWSREKLAPKLL